MTQHNSFSLFFQPSHIVGNLHVHILSASAYLRGGFRGFKPPPKFFDFFLKSEGKEIERKRKKGMLGGGGGGYHLTYFWG